jgi:hypothetical protein
VLIDNSNTIRSGKHERYDNEKIYGLVSVTEIVESDECLEVFFSINNNPLRRWILIGFHVEKRLEYCKYQMMIIHANV